MSVCRSESQNYSGWKRPCRSPSPTPRPAEGSPEGRGKVCDLFFSKGKWKRDSTAKLPSALGNSPSGWLGADGSPSPAKTSVLPPVGQHLHGAQGCQLHKGVCSDFMDPVVLETAGKTETGLRKELKAAATLCGKFCPMAAEARCHGGSRYSSLGEYSYFKG